MVEDNIKEQELEKAVKFHQYLQHLVKLRTSVVLDTSQYIDRVWLYKIPHHPLCHCVIWDYSKEEGDPIWVEVKRPVLPRVPQTPKECIDWVELKTLDNYLSEPVLKDKIIKSGTEQSDNPEYLDLTFFPDVLKEWRDYLDKSWKPWAKNYAEVKEVLDEHGLIEWKSIGEIGRGNFSGRGRITASGIDVIEKGPETSPIEIKIDNSQYNITESSNVQIGNKNVQDVTIPKEEKSLLQKLLENPLIKFFISLFTRK